MLVLCNSRSDVEKLKQHIQKNLPNKKVEFHHAGLGDDSRSMSMQIIILLSLTGVAQSKKERRQEKNSANR